MALKEILNQASQFQANAGSTGLDLSSMPIRLQRTFTFETADDFSGPKSALWKTSPAPQLLLEVVPNSSPNAHGWSNAQNHRAQTFKLAASKTVTRVGVRLSASPAGVAPGQVTVELQSTTGSSGAEIPSGTVLAAGLNPKPANTIVGFVSFPPPVFFTDFDLPPVTLQAGVVYALVVKLSAVNTSAATVYLWGENNDSLNYPNGRAVHFNPSSQQWEALPSTFIDDYDFRVYEGIPNPAPIVDSGSLQFDYPDAQPRNIETIYDSPRGSVELETRFIWTILDPNAQQFTPLEWGLHMLQGAIEAPQLSDSNIASKRLWELYIRPSAISNNLSFIPIVVDASGNRLTQLPSAPTTWQGYSNQGGWFLLPINAAAGVPITVKVLRQPNGGVIFTVYKNDDPNQVIFQTTASPPLRSLAGDVHLGIGHSPEAPGSRFRFDYFKLSGDVVEPDSGEVILRRSYPVRTKVTGYRMDRVLPAPGSRVNVRLRSANTLEGLAAAAFSAAIPGTVAGDVETGQVDLPAALFFDVKLEFIKASPGPTLNSFDFTVAQEAVEEDQPIILSVDEAGPGLVSAISSEEGLSETANTRKLVDCDPDSQWVSLGASDGSPVTLQLTFLAPSGGNELRNVNCLILRNTNLKALRVHIGVTTLFDGEILEDDVLIPFPLFVTPLIQIEAKTTKVPNQNKRIGEVYVGQLLLALPNFDAYEPRRRLFEAGSMRTLGGKLVAFRGKDKYASRWSVRLVDQAAKDEAERIFRQHPLVTFWPEPKFRPRALFDVGWKLEEIPFPYSDVLKPAGHTLEAEMEEI